MCITTTSTTIIIIIRITIIIREDMTKLLELCTEVSVTSQCTVFTIMVPAHS